MIFNFYQNFDEICLCKQNSPSCHILGYTVCLYPIKRTSGLYELKLFTCVTKSHFSSCHMHIAIAKHANYCIKHNYLSGQWNNFFISCMCEKHEL